MLYILTCSCRKHAGHSVDELPFKAAFGVYGSYVCAIMNFVCLAAQFYVALYPVGGPNLNAVNFFQDYLAGPFLVVLYIGWKAYSWFAVKEHRPFYVPIEKIDIYSGMREGQVELISGGQLTEEQRKQSIIEIKEENQKHGFKGYGMAIIRAVI